MSMSIPSFKKKYTLDPFTHMDFMIPNGEQGNELMSHIFDALNSANCPNGTYFDKDTGLCFSEIMCMIWCGEGQGLLPTESCTCVP